MDSEASNAHFWRLADQAQGILGCRLPLPLLRAFVILGRQQIDIELREAWRRILELEEALEKAELEAELAKEKATNLEASARIAAEIPESDDHEQPIGPLREFVIRTTRKHVMRAMAACHGNAEKAADLLGVSVAKMYRTMPALKTEFRKWSK